MKTGSCRRWRSWLSGALCVTSIGCVGDRESETAGGTIHSVSVVMMDSAIGRVAGVVASRAGEEPSVVGTGAQGDVPRVLLSVEGVVEEGGNRLIHIAVDGSVGVQGMRFLATGQLDSGGMEVIKEVRTRRSANDRRGAEVTIAGLRGGSEVKILVGIEYPHVGSAEWIHKLLPDSLKHWELGNGPVVVWDTVVASGPGPLDLGGPVYFRFDSAEIEREGNSVLCRALPKIVGTLNAQRAVTIEIEGHTDSIGDNEYNLRLGERRAGSVRDFFTAAGLDGSWFVTVSHGEGRPAEIRGDRSADAMNRRVEFSVQRHDTLAPSAEIRSAIVLDSLATPCGGSRASRALSVRSEHAMEPDAVDSPVVASGAAIGDTTSPPHPTRLK